MGIEKIAVLGIGRVGRLAAQLLAESGFDVLAVDQRVIAPDERFDIVQADIADHATLEPLLASVDAVLSCLPYTENMGVAQVAHLVGIDYFDLTEDVPTTMYIQELAATSKGLMAPQCGLAPGFVGIVGGDLVESLDSCRALKLRVGALPQHPDGLLGYAFNWSPAGVVNEYLNDCEVIEDGVHKTVSSMEWHETVYVGGTKLEAFTTSGGLGTMCDTYLGRVANIDYKTLRYPGHVDLMNFFFHELLMRQHRDLAEQILTTAKPPVSDDVVHVHVSAQGMHDDRLERREFVRSYLPRELAGEQRTAIAWTTAASVVAVIELVREGLLGEQGFVRQEAIPFPAFAATRTGSLFVAGG